MEDMILLSGSLRGPFLFLAEIPRHLVVLIIFPPPASCSKLTVDWGR